MSTTQLSPTMRKQYIQQKKSIHAARLRHKALADRFDLLVTADPIQHIEMRIGTTEDLHHINDPVNRDLDLTGMYNRFFIDLADYHREKVRDLTIDYVMLCRFVPDDPIQSVPPINDKPAT